MNPNVVTSLAQSLHKAEQDLELLRREMDLLRLSGHQQSVSLQVGVGQTVRPIRLSRMDARTYGEVQVRGVEMILLGVKKWYASEIEFAVRRIADAKAALVTEAKS